MAKLYPPAIEGKIPAFAGSIMRIPFTLNRAVAYAETNGVKVIIKSIQTNSRIGNVLSGDIVYEENTGNYYATFNISEVYSPAVEAGKVYPGQYYKVQIAFVDRTGEVGYYSSVGVIKCTTNPVIKIPAAESNYYNSYEYVGTYDQTSGDKTEKVYSYRFDLRDSNDNIVTTSGEQIHNSSADSIIGQSSDTWILPMALEEDKPYYLTYTVTTNNGLERTSPNYQIIEQDTLDADFPCWLIAEADDADGCVQLKLRPGQEEGELHGNFVLSRSSSEDDFTTWNEIYRFSYSHHSVKKHDAFLSESQWGVNDILLWEDFTVAQGKKYLYSIQAYNVYGLHSNRIYNTIEILDPDVPDGAHWMFGYQTTASTDRIYASCDFEDMFLFDGTRQLKLQFNPKVSSFKTNILEQKIDTIGGQHPFFFRNGNVNYKEFSISALLSLQSDPNERFLEGIQINRNLTRTQTRSEQLEEAYLDSWLVGDNIRRERDFKLAALQWLTNGEPKLFRSPTEGNYIVRLMNTSLAPNDTLGRMLHTVTATAYEMAEYNFDNLTKYGLVPISTIGMADRILKISQLQLASWSGAWPLSYHANFTECTVGTQMLLEFVDGTSLEVEIGSTGSYYVPIKDVALKNVTLLNGTSWNAESKFTYYYYEYEIESAFNGINNITARNEIRQWIGTDSSVNVIEEITNKRTVPGQFQYIKLFQRSIVKLYRHDTDEALIYIYSKDQNGQDIVDHSNWDPQAIYQLYDPSTDTTLGYVFSYETRNILANSIDYTVNLNGNMTDFSGSTIETDDGELVIMSRIDSFTDVGDVSNLNVGNGVVAEFCYRLKEFEYSSSIELADSVVEAKNAWIAARNAWMTDGRPIYGDKREVVLDAYKEYIEVLTAELDKEA